MFTEKTYECACPVCHEATQVVSSFFSSSLFTNRKDTPNTAFPASVCKGKHTRREVAQAFGFTIKSGKDPDEIMGA